MQGRESLRTICGVFCFVLISFSTTAATVPGKVGGSFSVSATGQANYHIPLDVPPGVNGLEPGLAINYASGTGNGLLGVGWSLSAGSSLYRCNATPASDGYTHAVDFSSRDRLCLDGQKLVAVDGAYWSAGAEYRTELPSFTRIVQHGSGSSAWFKAETKSGRVLILGDSGNSRITSPSHSDAIRTWLLSSVSDKLIDATTQSHINYHYAHSDNRARVVDIDYANGAGEIVFQYTSNRADPISGYESGDWERESHRLAAIIVRGSGAQIRRYALHYANAPVNNRSRLTTITEYGKDNNSYFRSLTLTYQDGGAGWREAEQLNIPAGYTKKLLDWDGDGILDILVIPALPPGIDVNPKPTDYWDDPWVLYHGKGNEQGYDSPRELPITDNTYIKEKVSILDVNADGREDLVLKQASGDKYEVIYSDGSFSSGSLEHQVLGSYPLEGGDVDGDGKPDIIAVRDGTSGGDGKEVFLTHSGEGGTTSVIYPVQAGSSVPSDHQLSVRRLPDGSGDLDGDGMADTLIVDRYPVPQTNTVIITDPPPNPHPDPTEWSQYVFLASYHDGQMHLRQLPDQLAALIARQSSDNQMTVRRYRFMDLNGDGLSDILVPGDANWMTALNKGNGEWTELVNTGIAVDMRSGSPAPVIVDYNEDGKMDAIIPEASTSPDTCDLEHDEIFPECAGDWQLYISDGTTLTAGPDLSAELGTSLALLYARDEAQNGLVDLFSNMSTVRRHAGRYPDLLVGIDDGYRNTYTIDYKPMHSPDVNTPLHDAGSLSRGTMEWQGSRPVVSHYEANSGTSGVSPDTYTVSYRYAGGKRNSLGRGFLGFEKRIVTDSRSGSVTYRFAQAWPYTGMLKTKVLRQAGGPLDAPTGQVISKTLNTLDTQAYGARQYPYIKTQVKNIYDLHSGQLVKSTRVTQSDLDVFGDPQDTLSSVATSDLSRTGTVGDFQKHTVKHYQAMASRQQYWCAGVPNAIEVTHTAAGASTTQRVSNPSPDYAHCRPTTHTDSASYAGQDLTLTTRYHYDSYGNVIQKTVTDAGTGQSRTVSTGYSADGRFPVSQTDAAQEKTTFSWDSATGLKQTETDPNGLTTRWTYDAFGRKTSVTEPNGASTSVTRRWCTDVNCFGPGVYRVYSATQDAQGHPGGSQFTVYDRFQRKIREGHQILGGSWSVVDTAYDSQGRIHSNTLPHSAGMGFAGAQVFRYDALDRKTQVDRPDGTTVTFAYHGLTTTVTDAASHKKVTQKDLMGRVMRVTEAQGTPDQSTLNYHYDPLGNLDWVEEPGENGNRVKVQMTYDARGNKREMTDPDMGHWTYTYNAFGELTQQTDAKGQVTQLDYDAAGRLSQRTTAQGTTTWTYGTQAPAIEQLVDVSQDWDGYRKHIDYNRYSQPKTITETIDGVDYQVTKSYDSFGRVSQVVYPDSVAPYVNKLPQAVIRTDVDGTVVAGTTARLDGIDSTDPDGWPQSMTFLWTQVDGPDVNLSGVTRSAVDVTLSKVGTYTFRLAVSDGDNVDATTVSMTVSPRKPTGFSVSPNPSTTGNFTLSWNAVAGVSPGGSYEVYRADDASQIANSTALYAGTEASYTVNGQGNGGWTYLVRGCKSGICGPTAKTGVLVTLPPSRPNAPSISPTVSHNGRYTVNWQAPNGQLTRYVLKESAATGSHTATLNGGTTSRDLTGKSNGSYAYAVKACNGTACSSYSPSKAGFVARTPGVPPSISVPTSDTNHDGKYTIHWQTSSGEVTRYQLQESRSASYASVSHNWNLGSHQSHAVTVTADGTYYYRVRACYSDSSNHQTCSAWRTGGNGINVRIRPEEPSSLSVSPEVSDSGDYTVSWGRVADHVTRYELFESADSTFDDATLVYNGSGRSKSLSKPTSRMQTYSYRVRACNHDVCSAYRDGAGVTIPGTQNGGCLKDPISCLGQADPSSRHPKSEHGRVVSTAYPGAGQFHAMHPPRPADLAKQAVARAGGARHAKAIRTAYSGDSSEYRVIVNYEYDNSGHLDQVKNHRTGKIYWHATQADAWDHQKQVQLGNGLTVNKRFNPDTGRLNSIRTGMGGGAGVQNLSYTWDDDGNLKSRTDNRTTHSEVFSYDAQHRLTGSTLDGQSNLTLTYDDAGNIASKTTESGTIHYSYSGSAGLHAVSGVSGAENHSYTYDANGNIDSRDGATVHWTPDNYPDRIAGNGTVSYFSYGPDHQRYREQIEDGAGHVKELRISVGTLFEVIQKADGTVKYQHHIKAAGVDIALETRQADQPKQTRYLLHDHLGGINAIADENGNVVARMSFGAYGKRRNADTWSGDLSDAQKQALHDQYNRGYTGHEMLDNLDLIHMNGRVYDQGIGRFMSPDPNIQAPGHSENYNRYAYAMNNPLTLNDPSGFLADHPGQGQKGRGDYCKDFGVVCKKESDEKKLKKLIDSWKHTSAEIDAVISDLKGVENGGCPTAPDASSGVTSDVGGFSNQKDSLLGTWVMGTPGLGGFYTGMGDMLGLITSPFRGGQVINPYTNEYVTGPRLFNAKFFLLMDAIGLGAESNIAKSFRNSSRIKSETSSGFSVTRHGVNQKINRGVRSVDELEALKNPLDVRPVKTDSIGRPSQRYIGEKAEVAVNPDTGDIISVNPTSTRKALRLMRRLEE